MKPQKFEAGRRDFLVKTAAVSGGLMLGVNLSGMVQAADAAGTPEVTHWVVIQPDDTVVIRIARSELGQGSFTGLAQLVAEELECDWSRVRSEYADVNEHVRRNRSSVRCRRAGVGPFANRRNTCAKPVRARVRCWLRQRRRNGACPPPSARPRRA